MADLGLPSISLLNSSSSITALCSRKECSVDGFLVAEKGLLFTFSVSFGGIISTSLGIVSTSFGIISTSLGMTFVSIDSLPSNLMFGWCCRKRKLSRSQITSLSPCMTRSAAFASRSRTGSVDHSFESSKKQIKHCIRL